MPILLVFFSCPGAAPTICFWWLNSSTLSHCVCHQYLLLYRLIIKYCLRFFHNDLQNYRKYLSLSRSLIISSENFPQSRLVTLCQPRKFYSHCLLRFLLFGTPVWNISSQLVKQQSQTCNRSQSLLPSLTPSRCRRHARADEAVTKTPATHDALPLCVTGKHWTWLILHCLQVYFPSLHQQWC